MWVAGIPASFQQGDNDQVTPSPRYRPFGDCALLVELDDLEQVVALDRALHRNRPAGVSDVIPAARTILVRYDAGTATEQQVASWVGAAAPTAAGASPTPTTVQ